MNTALAEALLVALLRDPAAGLAVTEDLGAVSPGGRRDLMKDMCPELLYVSGLVGTEFECDGEVVVAEEMFGSAVDNEVLVRDGAGRRFRLSLRECSPLAGPRSSRPGRGRRRTTTARGPRCCSLSSAMRNLPQFVSGLPMEVLTRFRSCGDGLAEPGEPRPQYATTVPELQRYEAKATEPGVSVRAVRRWARAGDREAGFVRDDPDRER
ncbi:MULTISPECIES: hypothetical protein [Streptomyces]|uniref:hypothetical protein n=1 Tax=Streptomyces TaxID=1883 RepID=UPI0016783CC6|nr:MULTISPECIES: hypothetical protein [Streptomyces]MBK3526605.1 hypothetical protein [Streptomyces sp. MBT70]GGR81468.1 hypothetical protein GCM10010236_40140 [Streptomyces eurythermus]